MNHLNMEIEIHGDMWKLKDIQDNIEWSKKQSW